MYVQLRALCLRCRWHPTLLIVLLSASCAADEYYLPKLIPLFDVSARVADVPGDTVGTHMVAQVFPMLAPLREVSTAFSVLDSWDFSDDDGVRRWSSTTDPNAQSVFETERTLDLTDIDDCFRSPPSVPLNARVVTGFVREDVVGTLVATVQWIFYQDEAHTLARLHIETSPRIRASHSAAESGTLSACHYSTDGRSETAVAFDGVLSRHELMAEETEKASFLHSRSSKAYDFGSTTSTSSTRSLVFSIDAAWNTEGGRSIERGIFIGPESDPVRIDECWGKDRTIVFRATTHPDIWGEKNGNCPAGVPLAKLLE